MKSSKVFFVVGIFLFIAMTAGVTWVAAKSNGGSAGKNATSSYAYLQVGAQPLDASAIEVERDALVALYRSTNGDEWDVSSGWLGTDDHCSWYGVHCDNGRVTQITLESNSLRGPIPPELGSLGDLRELQLANNLLSGSIPPELGNPC